MIGFWRKNGRPGEDKGKYCYKSENSDELSTTSSSDDTSDWTPSGRARSARRLRRGGRPPPFEEFHAPPPVEEIHVHSPNASSSHSSSSVEDSDSSVSADLDGAEAVQPAQDRGENQNNNDPEIQILSVVSDCRSE